MTALYSFWGILVQTLIVSLLFASSPAEGQNLRDIKVTVKAINVSFQEALQIIEQKTDFKFNYIQEEIPLKENVTISVTDESLYNILEVFANDYGLTFNRINNQITIKKSKGWETEKITSAPEPGTITGSVKHARSKAPIPGANILIIGLNIGAAADVNGNFTIKNVPAGKYELRASSVGYGKVAKSLVVQEGKTTSIDFLLDESAVGLDEVIVSGAAFETKRKEIPASVTVMTSKEIEKTGYLYFGDLLKGTIPGVLTTSSGGLQSDDTPFMIRGKLILSGDNAKVYIDGFEVSNSNFLGSLDINSIERIEVIRGPHASAMYGADALSGVINIITKKGGGSGLNRPQITARITGSYVELGDYNGETIPSGPSPYKTENTLSLSGGGSGFSYRIGTSANKTWQIIKDNSNDLLSFNGAARLIQGPFTFGITAQLSNYNRNDPSLSNYYFENPNLYPRMAPVGYRPGMPYANMRYENNSSTYGINILYQPTESWFNKIDIGKSDVGFNYFRRSPHYLTPADSFVTNNIYNSAKTTFRFNTSYKIPLSDQFSLNLSGGAEFIKNNIDSRSYNNIRFTDGNKIKTFSNTTYTTNIYSRTNSSYFATVDIGYLEKLYLSMSTSVLIEPLAFKKTIVVPPRFGLSYSDKFGDFEYILRGIYGGNQLPVNPNYVYPVLPSTTQVWLPNTDLISEIRKGWEVGTDLYFGKDASISITYFNEKGENSIHPVQIKSTPPITYQYRNAFDAKSNGIEFQGNANFGFLNLPSFNAKLVFTYNNNTYLRIDPDLVKNNSYYQDSPTGVYRVGERILGVPSHSGSFEINFDGNNWGAAISTNFQGGNYNLDTYAFYKYYFGNGIHRDAGKTYQELGSTFTMVWNGKTYTVSKNTATRSYYTKTPTYFKFDFKTYYKFSDMLTLFLNINNITNNSKTDFTYLFSTGRITTLGISVNY